MEGYWNQRSWRRSIDQQLHETAWNLYRASHKSAGKLLFPCWTRNHLGEDCQRRIGEWDLLGFLKGKDGSASLLPTDIWSILVTTSTWAITISITLYKTEIGKIAETTALIDSGAKICCINLHIAKRMKWLLEKLCRPMYAWNTDGTDNSRGMICHCYGMRIRPYLFHFSFVSIDF